MRRRLKQPKVKSGTKKKKPQDKSVEPTSPCGVNERTTSSGQVPESPSSDESKLIKWLKMKLLETQDRVEVLESDYQTLSSLVRRLVNDRDGDNKGLDDTCGGRIAVSSVR